jgi:predicted transcriptional regulator
MNTLPGDAVGTDLSNLSEEQKEAVRASHAVLDDYIVSFSNGGLKDSSECLEN